MTAQEADQGLRKPDRFVWPPRPLVEGQDPSASGPNHPDPQGSPAPIRAGMLFPELALAPPGRLGGLVRAWRQVEATWLGLAPAPLAERAAEAGWLPDGSGAYCPRCGSSVGPNEVAESRIPGRSAGDCPVCRRRNLPWARAVRLGEYTGLLRDLVHEIKFTAWRQLGTEVGRMLGRSLAAAMDTAGVDRSRAVLVAMPTTYTRRMGRGIDHARVIARGVREVTGMPLVRALERDHRRSQLSVPVSQRAANVAGSIRAVPGVDLSGLTVVVIDDVRTTGATMTAACRQVASCRPEGSRGSGGMEVWAAVVAVAPDPGRRRTEPAATADPAQDITGAQVGTYTGPRNG